jgi:type I restriction enzyme S subunit
LNTTVQKTLNLRDLAELAIPMPSDSAIEAVTSVLGALDDKIESNRRLAALFEQTAATLFKARFVEFLGAEQLESTSKGPIPRGWHLASLSDTARFVNGKAFTKHANGCGSAHHPDQRAEGWNRRRDSLERC